MAEIKGKTILNLANNHGTGPREKFSVMGRAESGISDTDVIQVIGILATDLSLMQPPIPGPYEGKIMIKTGRDFSSDRDHTVTAYFIRDDATTINAAQAGYFAVGFTPEITDKPK